MILLYNIYQYFSGVVKPSSESGWLPDIRKTPSLVSVISNPTNPTNSVASGKVEADSLVWNVNINSIFGTFKLLKISTY